MRISDWSSDVCSSDLEGGGGRGGEFIEPVIAAEDQGIDPSLREHPGQDRSETLVRAADGLRSRTGRIGQRSEQIEERRDPEFLARHGRMAQSRVARRRKAEGDAGGRSEEHTSELQ